MLREHVRNCCGSGEDSEKGMTHPYPYFGSILEHGSSKSYVFHWFYKVFRGARGHLENLRLRNVLAWFWRIVFRTRMSGARRAKPPWYDIDVRWHDVDIWHHVINCFYDIRHRCFRHRPDIRHRILDIELLDIGFDIGFRWHSPPGKSTQVEFGPVQGLARSHSAPKYKSINCFLDIRHTGFRHSVSWHRVDIKHGYRCFNVTVCLGKTTNHWHHGHMSTRWPVEHMSYVWPLFRIIGPRGT
jgi:hypothetical protein